LYRFQLSYKTRSTSHLIIGSYKLCAKVKRRSNESTCQNLTLPTMYTYKADRWISRYV